MSKGRSTSNRLKIFDTMTDARMLTPFDELLMWRAFQYFHDAKRQAWPSA